ncbi:MAG: insulinase family protein [Gammaproteobacteria bacterium]|nr:insulinase family protein [Gammaproteobacteria bacterium]
MTDKMNLQAAFKSLGTQTIESLNLTVEHYEHIKTGAMHYHLNTDNDENVFLVALRTVPMDSRGVAHILEHTALCGSENYPVRDPFFMMIRRSLNTFMNAFTSSDWTAYPFASKNKKDFNNLLDVYLDAVFFSRLHELDFLQEGHRVEFETPDDAGTDLVFKGVVYNEMKGAMSSPVSQLWQLFTHYLFPTTTYHYNSGGEPEHIPDLSYDDLKNFYQKHYHPSNAVFMTYGNIPAAEHQAVFEKNALSQFDKSDEVIKVDDEKRYFSPLIIEDSYALDEAEINDSQQGKTHHVMGWLLGKSTDLYEMLSAHLLSGVLLDNSSSPLMHALETCDIASAPSALCGLEDSNREMAFMCGLEGSQPEHAQAFQEIVLNVLTDVADNGVDQDSVEAVLHQLELSQREIGGDGYPYGLQLILAGLSAAMHRGNPIDVLNLDPVLEQLREDIKNTDFIPALIRKHLLDNPHRIRLTLKPDSKLDSYREQAEKQRLATIKAGLTKQQAEKIISTAEDLAARQQLEDDPEVLPKVGLDDVPARMSIAQGEAINGANLPLSFFPQATNGIAYQQLVVALPELSQELINVLPYYCSVLTELGADGKDYMQTQSWQASVSGGLSAYYNCRGQTDNEQQVSAYFVLSGKALVNKHDELTRLMNKTIETVSFDEKNRIRELMAQKRSRMEQSVTGSGHSLAMTAASSLMSPVANLSNSLKGLQGIVNIKKLDATLDTDDGLDGFIECLRSLHEIVLNAPRQLLIVADNEAKDQLISQADSIWQPNKTNDFREFSLPEIRQHVQQLWVTSTQVNFCAKAYQTVPVDHADAAALTVLGGFIRNGFLHTQIRENGGAYGGGASQDSSIAAFRFYSYRDPRLAETLADFDKSIDWMLETEHDPRLLEEAILGVIGSIDKPGSPAGEAKHAFHNALFGRTPEQQQAYRQRVLKVTLDDLKRVTEQYLKSATASVAVITSASTLEQTGDLGMSVHHL